MKLTVEQLKENFAHETHNKSARFNSSDVRDSMLDSLDAFAKEVHETRNGTHIITLSNNREIKMPAKHITLDRAVQEYYGCDMKMFLKAMGIDSARQSFSKMQEYFGGPQLNKSFMEDLLIHRGSIQYGSNGVTATKDFPSDFRFIIPEIFAALIRTAYEHASMHQAWIATTLPMQTDEIKMPRIERGDGNPSKIAEGGTIPVGSVKFGQKSAKVFKVGTGFVITDELMYQSSIDMVAEFLREVGIDMAIGADVEAIRVLVSGEQADGSESAPVVGVTTANAYDYKAIKRVFSRMRRLRKDATRLISNEEDGIEITGIDKFEGFQGQTKLSDIRSILGVPEKFEMDVHVLPSNQTMFLSAAMAMAKLQYRTMMVERRRNPENQTDELYVSDHIGFAILRRDARVLLDKSITYAGHEFPAYMDIDSRIATPFRS